MDEQPALRRPKGRAAKIRNRFLLACTTLQTVGALAELIHLLCS
jgi:hypothetical protein